MKHATSIHVKEGKQNAVYMYSSQNEAYELKLQWLNWVKKCNKFTVVAVSLGLST